MLHDEYTPKDDLDSLDDDHYESEEDDLDDDLEYMSDENKIREKIKNDKIFNNGYKAGDGLKEEDDFQYFSSLSVHSSYSDNYLKDIYEYEDTLDYNIGVSKIFELIDNDYQLKNMLNTLDSNDKLKLSKDEINWCFKRILLNMENTVEGERFYNPIYVLEVISSVLNINSGDCIKSYKKIFDCLEIDLQQDLIVELDKKYNFLDGKLNRKKIH